jgi:hypothetical protein
LHTKKFVQLLDGFSRAAVGREHRQKLLQFVIVEPQAVAAGTFIEGQGGGAGVFDLDLVQSGIATGAKVRTAFGFRARLVLKFQQAIGGLRARSRHDGFQLAGVEPETAALMAEIDVKVPEMQDEQRDITFWTDASHVMQNLVRNDGARGVCASSTSRVTTVSGSRTFIIR